MAAASYKSVALDGSTYLDLVALATSQNSESISGLDLTFQNCGPSEMLFFFGGSAPTGRAIGHKVGPGQTIYGSAVDNVWVKGRGDVSFWVS